MSLRLFLDEMRISPRNYRELDSVTYKQVCYIFKDLLEFQNCTDRIENMCKYGKYGYRMMEERKWNWSKVH